MRTPGIVGLTNFLEMPEVTAKIKPLRPKLPRKIAALLQAEPCSNRYMLVGTAFDYFLRFELQRRVPHAITERWAAEYVPDVIWREAGDGVHVSTDLLEDALMDANLTPEEAAKRFRLILADAKTAVTAYIESRAPSHEMQADLAEHAIRLAKLDSVYRAGRLDPRFQEADPADVRDLLNLLRIVPFDALLDKTSLFLNPTFPASSLLIGGADADLIAGNLLVDFKTTIKGEMAARDLDQLLGYFLLARKQHQSDPSFPAIQRLGLYFSRHGFLWTAEASIWTEHPEFSEIEQWFFRRATEYAAKRK